MNKMIKNRFSFFKFGRFCWLAGILLVAGCVPRHTTLKNFASKPHPNQLRVISYNINWGEGPWKIHNPMVTVNLIKTMHPDVILLQETTPRWEKYFTTYLKAQYPYQKYKDVKQGGGMGILSKYPIMNYKVIKPGPGWYPASLQTIKTPVGVIQFVNLHLVPTNSPHNSDNYKKISLFKADELREEEINYFYHHIKHNKPTIIGGDFNEGEFGRAATYLRHRGFHDVLAAIPPHEHTWRWQVGMITMADRYDHIFYTPSLKLVQAQVLHEGPSDHFPVVADFDH